MKYLNNCEYNEIPIDDNYEKNSAKNSRMPFIRQLLICSGLWTTYFNTGLCLGAPTVTIPQLNSTGDVSVEMASWLSSALSYSAMPWVVVLPLLTQLVGRKPPLICASIMSVASFFVFYFGTTKWTFLIAQILQGILFSSNLTISVILITEYTSPEYRGIFLTIKSASIFWGVWVSNAIGTFLPWNHIGSFGLFCSGYYLTFFLWPESPTYLATKGKFKECAKSHRWLRGTGDKAEDELKNLIDSQKTIFRRVNDNSKRNIFKNILDIVSQKAFYKPILLCLVVVAQQQATGKLVCAMYSLELIKSITGNQSTAYIGMLVLDGASVLGMYVGCVLSKFLKRRTLLLVFSAIGIFFLFSISIYLLLVNYAVLEENKVITIALLSAFSISISCGPMILSLSIYAELLPLRFKNIGVIIIIFINFALTGTSLKLGPLMFRALNLYGTFGFYGSLTTFFTLVLYKYLPETKDKPLYEIEEIFK